MRRSTYVGLDGTICIDKGGPSCIFYEIHVGIKIVDIHLSVVKSVKSLRSRYKVVTKYIVTKSLSQLLPDL